MKVWIDQDLCTGDGLCEEIAPDVFAMLDDGLAYVKDGDKILSEPSGAAGVAPVPDGLEEATIESAEECPGECNIIELARLRQVRKDVVQRQGPAGRAPAARPSMRATSSLLCTA